MRVAFIRTDLAHQYLDDIENTSQRNFSSEPAGQSRYFHVPTDAELAAMLSGAALVTKLGTVAQPFNTTVANGTLLNIRSSATGTYTQVAVRSGAAVTAAQIVSDLNSAFQAAGLPFTARADATNHVAIDTNAGGPNAYIELSATTPSAAALQTVLGLATAAVSGLTVAALKTAVYIGSGAVAGQTGAAAAISSVTNGSATVTGLTGMTAASVGHCLTISGSTHPTNNGTFRITQFISATSVVISNVDAVVDAGALTWTEFTTLTVDVSAATLNALSTFANMTTAQQAALDAAVANLVAPSLVETGPVLLSFAFGKLSKLRAAAFQPGSPLAASEARIGLPPGAAVAIVANDGVTPFVL